MERSIWIPSILIIVGFTVMFLNKGCSKNEEESFTDTTYSQNEYHTHHDTTIYIERPVPYRVDVAVIPEGFLPKSTYDSLSVQYDSVCKVLFSIHKYRDTFRSGNSWLSLSEETYFNQLQNRKFSSHIDEKVIEKTQTITINNPPEKKSKLLIGFNASGNEKRIQSAGIGLAFINKKDALIQVEGKYDFFHKDFVYEAATYYKISLKRNR